MKRFWKRWPMEAALAARGTRAAGSADSHSSTLRLMGWPPAFSDSRKARMARATPDESIFTGQTEVQRPQPVQCSIMARSSPSRKGSGLPLLTCE